MYNINHFKVQFVHILMQTIINYMNYLRIVTNFPKILYESEFFLIQVDFFLNIFPLKFSKYKYLSEEFISHLRLSIMSLPFLDSVCLQIYFFVFCFSFRKPKISKLIPGSLFL